MRSILRGINKETTMQEVNYMLMVQVGDELVWSETYADTADLLDSLTNAEEAVELALEEE